MSRFRVELRRDVVTRGGAPLVRVMASMARPARGSADFDVTPEELWELIAALLYVASGGLLPVERT
jgi:hypothetical protein